MNKQTAEKTDFFLRGILGRLEDSYDFFIGFDGVFYSGTKSFSFKAKLSEPENKLEFIYSGVKHKLTVDEFILFVKAQIINYDKAEFIYRERGKNISLFANEKKVFTQTSSNEKDSLNVSKDLEMHSSGTAVISEREYFVKPNKAQKLLKIIGIMGENGKVKNDMIRKYNQIDHFVELLHPLLLTLSKQNESINIVDCACGKSYLSFVLNYYIKEVMGKKCYFTGLDYNGNVIKESKKMAAELGYNNMIFVETDIMNYTPDKKYNLLLTLHACDTATDKALSFALQNQVNSIVCVPCCHREMNSQYKLNGFEDVLKYGVIKSRIAASLTDGMRALFLESYGYEVSIVEYVSPLDTPKNVMIKALKVKGNNNTLAKKFNELSDVLNVKLTIANDK